MIIPNVVNFRNVCYHPLGITFEYILFSFSPFGTIREVSGWDGFLNTAELNKTMKKPIKM